jgi:sugar phosphate isomerase/epimerase
MIDRENEKIYFDLLDTAIDLGAKTFVVGINYDDSITLYKNYENAISFFGDLIKRAEGRIKIAVQNCHWNNFVLSPREWEVIMPELPELCIKYDPSHAYNRGADYLSEMSDWGERIAHFHVKGTVHAGERKVDDPPAGMDDITWGSVFATLYSRGYNGDLSIEPHSRVWQGDLGAAGVMFTKSFIEKFLL